MTDPFVVSEALGRVAVDEFGPDTDGSELATRLGTAAIALGSCVTGGLLTWLFYCIVTMLFIYTAISCILCILTLLSTLLPFNPRLFFGVNVIQIVLLQIGPIVAFVDPVVAWAYEIPLQIFGLY